MRLRVLLGTESTPPRHLRGAREAAAQARMERAARQKEQKAAFDAKIATKRGAKASSPAKPTNSQQHGGADA